MGNWQRDHEDGMKAELRVAAFLAGRGEPVIEIASDRFPDWDLRTAKWTYECKMDRFASKTGRVFIETSYRGKPSGLYGTKADWWVMVIGDVAWVVRVRDLSEWLQVHSQVRGVKTVEKAGDDQRSAGLLVDVALLPRIWNMETWKL